MSNTSDTNQRPPLFKIGERLIYVHFYKRPKGFFKKKMKLNQWN